MRSRFSLLGLLCLTIVAGGAGFLLLRGPGAERRCVLIITVDTLRADAAGIGKGTPAIERFLATATHFARARTVVPLTLPSHLTLFSGLYPASHGVHENVAPRLPPRESRGFSLLAEEFATEGYATAAFVARGVLGPETGIGAGFGHSRYPESQGREESDGEYIAAAEQVRRLREWLAETSSDRPWFVWVHLFDPHKPYHPFAGDAERARTPEGAASRALYEGEVRRADAAIGEMIQAVGEEAIVVVVSDHGEGLGDHGEPTHGALCYGSTIDAFLAVRAPRLARGAVDTGPRSLCDVAPTLRRWCGLAESRSDGPLLDGPPAPCVLSESLLTWRIHGWGQCFSASDGRFTLVESGSKLQLFDRQSDPGELRALPAEHHAAYERLDRALLAYRAATEGEALEEAELLASVAPYAGLRRPFGGYLSRSENQQRPDPRHLLAVWAAIEAMPRLLQTAWIRRDAAATAEMVERLRSFVEDSKGSPLALRYLAQACSNLGRLSGDASWHLEATRAERRALEKGYLLPEVFESALASAAAGVERSELATQRSELAIQRSEFMLILELALQPGLHLRLQTATCFMEGGRRLGLLRDPEIASRLRAILTAIRDTLPTAEAGQVAAYLDELSGM